MPIDCTSTRGCASRRFTSRAPSDCRPKLATMIRPEEAQRPFTVTELANEIRRELRPLTAMLVKGEVSGMKRGAKGHFSFAIKDGQSLINGFLYADDARRVTTLPEDGQVFVFRGRVDFWTQYGTIRFVVDQIEFDDVGKLRARLEELKRRLEAEGAFAAARKRPLPFLPDAGGGSTASPTSACCARQSGCRSSGRDCFRSCRQCCGCAPTGWPTRRRTSRGSARCCRWRGARRRCASGPGG